MEKIKFQKYSLRRKHRRRQTNLRNYAAFIITTIFVVVTASCVKSAHLNVNTISVPNITASVTSSEPTSSVRVPPMPADTSLESIQKLQHLNEEERAEAVEEAVEIELQESSLYNLPVMRESVVPTTTSTPTTIITTTMNALNTAIDTDSNTNINRNAQDINNINISRRRNIPTHFENNLQKQQQQIQPHTRHPQYQHQHYGHQHNSQQQHHRHHESLYGNQHKQQQQHLTPTTQHHHQRSHNSQLKQNNYDFIKVDDDGSDQLDQNSPQAVIKSADEYYSQLPWHKHHSKYSIEDLLNSKFERKVSNDIDMDPCKADY